MKLLSKTLIAAISTFVLAQGLSAQTTICYKKDWKSPSTIETTKLEGGECKGELSFAQMKKWLEIKRFKNRKWRERFKLYLCFNG